MKTVKQFLAEQPSQALYSVHPDATVFQALQLMADADVGAVLVMDGDALLGLFVERDYARKIILLGKSSAGTPVADVMTRRIPFAKPGHTLDQCLAMMAAERLRYMPVMEGHTVLGVLSIDDLVREQVDEQRFTIDQLELYIHGVRKMG